MIKQSCGLSNGYQRSAAFTGYLYAIQEHYRGNNTHPCTIPVATMDLARYAFRVEYWNELAGSWTVYQLLYYTRRDGRNEVELIELRPAGVGGGHRDAGGGAGGGGKSRKFLARVHYPALKLEDIRPGGKINMYVVAVRRVSRARAPFAMRLPSGFVHS